MKRSILLGLLLACAALLLWVLAPFGAESREAATTDLGERTTEEDVPADIEGDAAVPARVSAREAPNEAPARPPAAATEVAPAPIDKKARDWVHLIVQDRQGAPVPNADVRMVGLRTKREPGSHWGWPGEPSIGRTAQDGTAKLWHPVWVTADLETGELTFTVSHPDFVTETVDSFTVGPEPRVVVLERGAFVIVSGWIDDPAEVVQDVVPHLTWEVELPADAWQPIRDGRLSTANVPIGPHAIYLSHAGGEFGPYFSAVTPFTLEEGEQKELHLPLVPAVRLEGKLEDEVPRPVVDGTVLLNLQVGAGATRVKMLREFKAPIRADGVFTIADLPPGDGQIIALCEGWASERVVDLDPGSEESASPADRGDMLASKAERALIAQRVDPTTSSGFVLRMEPTAALKAVVRGPDGKPVEGAVVTCWPNVRWLAGYSSMFLGKSWSATSDARGELVVPNMPWGTIWYGISHPDLDVPLTDGNRSRQASLEPGKTTEIVLDLEVKEK